MTKKEVHLIPLKQLCEELSITPKDAREKLRFAVKSPDKFPVLAKEHKPKMAWQWLSDSQAYEEARVVLMS
jgi:hypothetical protein